jgi:hypothetical protein
MMAYVDFSVKSGRWHKLTRQNIPHFFTFSRRTASPQGHFRFGLSPTAPSGVR